MGELALGSSDARHQSVFVELDDRSGQIEVDRASSFALAIQNQGQVAHHFECQHQFSVALARPGIAFED